MRLAPNARPSNVLGPAAPDAWNTLAIGVVSFCPKRVYANVTASSASPTTMNPVTAPPRKAVDIAAFSPTVPACAVRTLARTATFMPM
jgi:hypothetical protein